MKQADLQLEQFDSHAEETPMKKSGAAAGSKEKMMCGWSRGRSSAACTPGLTLDSLAERPSVLEELRDPSLNVEWVS